MKILLTIIMICSFQIANARPITLTSRNHCSLEDSVDSKSMQKLKFCLADKVALRRARNYPIYLVINSPGGSIYAGLRFISFAKGIKNLDTITIFAASMGSAIVEALPGKRYGTEHAVTMFHRAKGSFRGQFEDGEVESKLKLWKRIVRGMETVSSKRIGITLKEYKKRVKDEWWVYGSDNVVRNTLDKIVQVKCSNKLISSKREVKIRTLFGSFKKTVSDCPLVN